MNYTIVRLWQKLTNQVCMCNHEEWYHVRQRDKTRSDVQCLAFIFEGGAFGGDGTLHCCQCLSYHRRGLPKILRPSYYVFKIQKHFAPKVSIEEFSKMKLCICGHSAFDHDIGNPEYMTLDPMYPPCRKCECKEYEVDRTKKEKLVNIK